MYHIMLIILRSMCAALQALAGREQQRPLCAQAPTGDGALEPELAAFKMPR